MHCNNLYFVNADIYRTINIRNARLIEYSFCHNVGLTSNIDIYIFWDSKCRNLFCFLDNVFKCTYSAFLS